MGTRWGKFIEPQPIEQQFTHVEENAEDIFGSRNSRRFIQSEENEEPEVEQPLESNVTRERVRNIFLEPDTVEEVDSLEQEDPYAKLTEMKKLLDAGVITQEDFDAVKAKLLGI